LAGSTNPGSYHCPSPTGWRDYQVELVSWCLGDGNGALEVTALCRTSSRSGKEPEASGCHAAISHRYRAMYQYRPQNEDELELREGDRVDVMQQCDDGWFVGM
jgi:hypothetical protein